MNYLLGLLLGVMVSCSGLPLASKKVRQQHFHIETKVSGSTGYHRSLGWLDKNLLPIEGTAMEQMGPEGKLRLRAKGACQVLSPEHQAENRFLTFWLTLETRDKSVDAYFEDIKMVDEEGNVLANAVEQLSSQDQVKKIEPCLSKLVNGLRKGIADSKINWE